MSAKKPQKKSGRKKSVPKKKNKQRFGFKTFAFLFLLILAGAGLFIYITQPESAGTQIKKGFYTANRLFNRLSEPLRTTEWQATLYFADENFNHLVKEYRTLKSIRNAPKMSERLIRELIKGPEAKGIRTLPEQTRLLSATVNREGLATLNFSKEFTQLHPGGSSTEIMTVYAIVNTLTTNIKDVKMVRIIQDNRPLDTIAGHLDCNKTFYPDLSLVQ